MTILLILLLTVSHHLYGSSIDGLENIFRDGIYWSRDLEKETPKGFDLRDDRDWNHLVSTSSVIKISEGCGRLQNRLVILEDGNSSCARHRQNNDQIQGDIFSFHLSRILGIGNLPPATLSLVKSGKDPIWDKVKHHLHLAQWNVDKPVVLTKYIEDLSPAFIPPSLRHDERRIHPIKEDFRLLNRSQLIELVQWSDLIVFDYLTANLDRIVNNMFNQQWNPEMMNSPAHNLVKKSSNGLLLFIDNESGLLHGYRLLRKYEHLHRSLLEALCVFRKNTADIIEYLYKHGNVMRLMRKSLHDSGYAPNKCNLPFLPERNGKILNERIATVYKQIDKCKQLFT